VAVIYMFPTKTMRIAILIFIITIITVIEPG
jgi:hypothetical protein